MVLKNTKLVVDDKDSIATEIRVCFIKWLESPSKDGHENSKVQIFLNKIKNKPCNVSPMGIE